MIFEQIGGALKDGGAFAGRHALPTGGARHGAGERLVDLFRTGHDDRADLTPAIAGVEDRLAFARLLDPANDRGGMPRLAKRPDKLVAQRG